MERTFCDTQFEHHFEIDGEKAEYKFSIGLQHGELISAKVSEEIIRELYVSEGVRTIRNLI